MSHENPSNDLVRLYWPSSISPSEDLIKLYSWQLPATVSLKHMDQSQLEVFSVSDREDALGSLQPKRMAWAAEIKSMNPVGIWQISKDLIIKSGHDRIFELHPVMIGGCTNISKSAQAPAASAPMWCMDISNGKQRPLQVVLYNPLYWTPRLDGGLSGYGLESILKYMPPVLEINHYNGHAGAEHFMSKLMTGKVKIMMIIFPVFFRFM